MKTESCMTSYEVAVETIRQLRAENKARDEAGEKYVYQQQRADKFWVMLCETAEALGKVAPEAAPYTSEWARQLRAELQDCKSRLRFLSEHWNPKKDFRNDEIGRWIVIGDHNRMIDAIDEARAALAQTEAKP